MNSISSTELIEELLSYDNEHLQSTLKGLLDCYGKTQEWLAKEAGTTPPTISRYISGKARPTLSILLKIANVLDVSVEFLCGITEGQSIDLQTKSPILDEMKKKEIAELEEIKRKITVQASETKRKEMADSLSETLTQIKDISDMENSLLNAIDKVTDIFFTKQVTSQ